MQYLYPSILIIIDIFQSMKETEATSMHYLEAAGKGVNLFLSVYTFKDAGNPSGDVWNAYCPELDLVGCGHGEEEAKESLKYVLSDYIDYTTEHNTLEDDLIAHGWRKLKSGRLVEPDYKKMVSDGRLDNVFSMKDFSKSSLPVAL